MRIFTGIIIMFSVLILSCSPVRYFTLYEGGHDPIFNMKHVKTIGFMPFAWTKWNYMDELTEKQIFVYARNELQKRGYTVFYIPKEYLEQDTILRAVYVKADYENMPDLTLTLGYGMQKSNVVHVPGQSGGVVNWNKYGGGGYYGESQGYDVQTYGLILEYTLWSGKPKYMDKVWTGKITKGSPKTDLFEQAPYMAAWLFYKKFDN